MPQLPVLFRDNCRFLKPPNIDSYPCTEFHVVFWNQLHLKSPLFRLLDRRQLKSKLVYNALLKETWESIICGRTFFQQINFRVGIDFPCLPDHLLEADPLR